MTRHLAFTLSPGNYRWGAIHISPPFVDKRHWRVIAAELAEQHETQMTEIFAKGRPPPRVARAKQHIMAYLNQHGRSISAIARMLGLDHSTIIYGVKTHGRRTEA